ncbi:translocation and assembly module lipoprotein TamL [Flavobacterium aciduliphilum]|uniref:Surface antigen-like protein n=1 Tax=Flavobacterium aciduliphilum TaxID=1101402 RepID=A0A328YIZ7_9FLAO|nr:BamA/TamA family outer membrane protein [Flavobacterium aciduliphilum]RAR74128.1 surface antigen-like protein [Flavobacterium aciduliphilum]
MKKRVTKISLFILIGLIIISCTVTKRVPDTKRLLTRNEIAIDSKKTTDENLFFQLYQKPNSSILGYRLRLHLFYLTKKNPDSTYSHLLQKNPHTHATLTKLLSEKQVGRLGKSFLVSGWSNFLSKIGETPVIFDSVQADKSVKRLESYFYNKGYFNVKAGYKKNTTHSKKIAITYDVNLHKVFNIDSLKTNITSTKLDSLYQSKKSNSLIKSGTPYNTEIFNNERSRITNDFRNNGAYLFQQNNILYKLDTINTSKKVNVTLVIKDYEYRENDSSKTTPFKLYKINKVAIYTDQSNVKNEVKINDSLSYKNVVFYTEHKLKYRPKAITDAVFISKGSLFSDNNTLLTTRYLNNLRIFKYPTILYKIDPKDANGLIASIYLTPKKKYSFNPSVDFTHSTIQDFGISGYTSLAIRNVFNGAEIFEVGFRGNVGASRALSNPNNTFFNISEIGLDAKLNFPRILFPINTEKIIPKSMIPSTVLSVGYTKQRNIGLDKQNFTSTLSYNWSPRKNIMVKYDMFNIQFVKNVNVGNYFNIYQSSYNALNTLAHQYAAPSSYFDGANNLVIENGTNGFLNDVLGANPSIFPNDQDLKTIRSIEERKNRLTENNLIFASNFSFSKTSSKNLSDRNFYSFKSKIEAAGNFLSLLARMSKQLDNQGGANTFFEVQYSQYIKGEFEFIKHWNISGKKVFAIRSFAGLAVPYGNSNSIPFSRSYFSGGSNDNRAWQPYSLGPGRSGGLNDFNEANMKLSLSSEFRFNLFYKFNGALFADAGNIWNVFDNVVDENFTFNGLKSLKDIALGSGLGIRYDQGLFVVRFDFGFKTYNPAKPNAEKWFREVNFPQGVLNIGINYPF